MNAQQKHAWYNLAVFAAAVAAYVALVPIVGVQAAGGAFGLCGLWGFGAFFYRKRRRPVVDERDRLIHRRSLAIAYGVFWLGFVAACMVPWWVLFSRGRETISIHVLPQFVFGGMIVVVVTQSVATLIQYGRNVTGAA